MRDRITKRLPDNIRPHYEAALDAIVKDSLPKLKRDLARFEATLRPRLAEGNANERVIRECLIKAKILSSACDKNPGDESVPYCLAAIDYFVFNEDNDFDSFDGFDDDKKVLDVVTEECAVFLKKAA